MKLTALFCLPAHAGSFVLPLLIGVSLGIAQAQNEPILVPDAVDYQKLLPILPEPPKGWTADKAEGSTEDVGGFRITNVHRDYHKGERQQHDAGNQAGPGLLGRIEEPICIPAVGGAPDESVKAV